MAGGPQATQRFPVLLVEDDAGTRALLAREIAEAGYPLRHVADGHEALSALALQRAAIVVSDIVLPGGLDGVQLCRAIRESHPFVELILVTGFASIATAIEGVRLGACDYLQKPLEAGVVTRALARASARLAHRHAEMQVVDGLRARVDGQAALLDRLAIPIVIADGQARVQGRNSAAEALLGQRTAISVGDDGRLRAARPVETQALHAALASCCAATPSDATTVPLSTGNAVTRLRAVVAPLSASGGTGSAPLAAVLVDLPNRSAVAPNAEMLCSLHGLTPAEGQLAARLVAGDSVQEACEALGIALATGRTHLSRVFAKTGAARQADLVGLVLTGPALLATGFTRATPGGKDAR
jgi:FixJ family two-component response regulator